ncbi:MULTISPECIES: RrF2 family transcriptional regulator [Streptomyces]|uniref:Predicted transcriptional regulator of 4-carboxymuconolactone decarboxylase, Rrf2 family n=1 Tax=Streptomyces venezuelae (strain ATCC 10712 / CBS 650.69 / DSM 40230 / JCM 4526 / NBRC 13096 / PD 04745) TaxID=953739 RepID=F2RBW3_STRVP|nr:Rrf2 family transcriptional regulator [Streptomyces venezuelae]QES03710.1 Rrf2 family transcriptional regulator [Streptomyces venezuelae ATCC 10712]CCA56824.1 Predicted transcriptional regulator of 4-carboxymuconolactone decarboxylase, Rrf2 family [Streptomyces venezuelae ATCC 10712]
MSDGVEWALHSCLNLAWIGSGQAVTAARLAAYHELPPAYLNKQLQALARAGIVTSVSGPKGGFRLARALDRITLMDVVAAIEGPDEAFRCTEIRQQGPGAAAPESYAAECAIAGAMSRAELAWRRELMAQTLDDVRARAELQAPDAPERLRHWLAHL